MYHPRLDNRMKQEYTEERKRIMKKLLCLLLVAVLVLPIVLIPVQADDPVESEFYADVFEDDPYCEAVTYLYHQNIMRGTSDPTETQLGLFSPNSSTTRGQIITVLWRMAGRPDPDGTVMSFTDCFPNTYYYAAVQWASSSNVQITHGWSQTQFLPHSAVSHQEVITFLFRFLLYYDYIDDDDMYYDLFVNSDLVNKESFSNFSKRAVGWAVYSGILTDNTLVGNSTCIRSSIAQYLYLIYQQYQAKYGLSVSKNIEMIGVDRCSEAMRRVFSHYGAAGTENLVNISKAQFSCAMHSAFSNARPLDICYLYCASHGSEIGLLLFTNTGSDKYLTPTYLRSLIDEYMGTFVVFIFGCHSGTFITDGNTELNGIEVDFFDAEEFVNDLLYPEGENTMRSGELVQPTQIKVLCSSEKNEKSYYNENYNRPTYYWCYGCGYDLMQDENYTFGTLLADDNADGRITLAELYAYAYPLAIYNSEQHMVCSPQNDVFFIFELCS